MNYELMTQKELLELILDAEKKYYETGERTISDAVYDRLLELADPTRVAYIDNKSDNPMLSLRKTKSIDELIDFCNFKEHKYLGQMKIDGLALALIYDNGRLIGAKTRGGVAVSSSVYDFLPPEIDYTKRIEIRGEIYVSYDNFTPFTRIYANPRSLAAASVLGKGGPACKLDFSPYQILGGDDFKTDLNNLVFLDSLGFEVLSLNTEVINNRADLIRYVEDNELWNDEIPRDGLVIKIDNLATRGKIGSTLKYPKWALAYKFADPVFTATLLDITYKIGATGRVTPIAFFSPVVINGVTIQKASLGSRANLDKLGIDVGDTIKVCLANSVIPQVLGRA